MWQNDQVSGAAREPGSGESGGGVYVAWNGREYPLPPPAGWERRSDGRYWPVDSGGSNLPPSGFGPQHGGPGLLYAPPDTLPPPSAADRMGSRPLRRRGIAALATGAFALFASLQLISMDILGFTVEQQDFVGNGDDGNLPDFAPVGEERELSPDTIAELIEITSCSNDGTGAHVEGTVTNPLEGPRGYSITIQFRVDGDRQLDGFAEVDVPPGVAIPFSAVSASPSVDGPAECSIGTVIRFIPE